MSFETHKLNEVGFHNVKTFKENMTLLKSLMETSYPTSREMSMFVTKLEEACFWGTKVIAQEPCNHTEKVSYDSKKQ